MQTKTFSNILKIACLSMACTFHSAQSGERYTKNSSGVFGVVKIGESKLLTRSVLQAMSDAASAYGLNKEHKISTIDGLVLSKMFDATMLTEEERKVKFEEPLQSNYVLLTGILGGGCIGIPTWSLPAKKRVESVPVGVTRVRCAKTDAGYTRLLKVARAAMEV